MAAKRLLTWDKTRKRWKKKYKGRQHYFQFGNGKSDDDGYRLALDAWKDLKAKLDDSLEVDTEKGVSERERIIKWYSENFHADQPHPYERWDAFFHDDIQAEINYLQENRDRLKPLSLDQLGIAIDPLWGADEEKKSVWRRRLPLLGKPWAPPATSPSQQSVGKMIDRFVEGQQARAEAGQVTPSFVQTMAAHLASIKDFLGTDTSVGSINAQSLQGYHTALLKRIGKKEISPEYADTLMATFVRFVKWLYATEVIDALPRVIVARSTSLTFNVTPKAIKTYTKDEIKRFLDNASERTKLFLLLMLNTGMTQIDISELRPSEVDWKTGRITRKRTKTNDQKNVPTVSYKLWPETLKLLKKYESNSKDRVLTNDEGRPLRSFATKANGKPANLDNIRSAFERLRRKLKIKKSERMTLKILRKTAASTLEGHRDYGRFAQYFLGHSPKTIAEKHYVVPSKELFDEAIEWLGKELGVVK